MGGMNPPVFSDSGIPLLKHIYWVASDLDTIAGGILLM
jgi:hypothetical protein